MEGFWDLPKNKAMEEYSRARNPSLTDQLLYAILAQLDKVNHQLSVANEDKEES